MSGHVLRLLRISLNVADLPRAQAFYRDALGFALRDESDASPSQALILGAEGTGVRAARLGLGGQELELVAYDRPGAGYPPRSTAADLWFQHFAIVTNDMASACGRLDRQGAVAISEAGPQRLPVTSGGVLAYKFRDPDGHPLELIEFPPGKGYPASHGASTAATIGIDHSALSVADASRSLAFYGALGLGIRSRQVNTGAEQDRLDGLVGAVVDVIGLSTATSSIPHVELLCYRTPRGRPADPDRQGRDIADSRLIFQVEDLAGLVEALAPAGTVVSPIVEPTAASRVVSARDPDGHAVILLEDHGRSLRHR